MVFDCAEAAHPYDRRGNAIWLEPHGRGRVQHVCLGFDFAVWCGCKLDQLRWLHVEVSKWGFTNAIFTALSRHPVGDDRQ
jgi:hypothetical protein